jgi:hypothetical protein
VAKRNGFIDTIEFGFDASRPFRIRWDVDVLVASTDIRRDELDDGTVFNFFAMRSGVATSITFITSMLA